MKKSSFLKDSLISQVNKAFGGYRRTDWRLNLNGRLEIVSNQDVVASSLNLVQLQLEMKCRTSFSYHEMSLA